MAHVTSDQVREVAHGLIEFVLPTEAAKNWVLQRTPWVIMDKILHLRSWTPNITARTFEEMATAPFRVQMWDVQEECCTQLFGRKVATSTLGRVLESGIFSCTDTASTFIKVKTLIDFSKPLRSQIWASNEETGSFSIGFKYEHLPSFCYNCGRVGHFRQSCVFDSPSRKERFGPHMTTKKMGRNIFDEDDHNQGFSGHPNSVWINSNARQMPEREARPEPRTGTLVRRAPPTAKKLVVDKSPLWMGSSENPFAKTEPAAMRAKQGRSPRQFPTPKAAKVPFGRPNRRGRGQVAQGGSPMEIDECTKERQDSASLPRRRGRNVKSLRAEKQVGPAVTRRQQGRQPAAHGPIPPAGNSSRAGALEETRRRRLILEEESEDDFAVQPIPSIGQEGPRPPLIPADPYNSQGGHKMQPLTRRKGKESRGSDCPSPKGKFGLTHPPMASKPAARRNNKEEKKAARACSLKPKAGSIVEAQDVQPEPANWESRGKKGGLPPSPKAGPILPEPNTDPLDSEATFSEDEAQNFELRRRVPSGSGVLKRLVKSSRVSKVVRAFERGLAMEDKEEVADLVQPQARPNAEIITATDETPLDEYGTNLPELGTGMKKRHFDEIDGVFVENPTPKKQFVEDRDDMEKVEEASLKWPQSDK
ncbi:unnamed protein product [Linum trigynum]|uniref:CCHC-type domain-containing protein n=1 Tax=Linum trigynum TaxID=586398 RepID=A0AAV2CGJ4_9ROSI